jgi:hypothetical protein
MVGAAVRRNYGLHTGQGTRFYQFDRITARGGSSGSTASGWTPSH